MKHRLLISEEAYEDIVQAILYYRGLSSNDLENRFKQQLKGGIDYISLHPQHFAIKYRQIRIYNLRSFPY